MGAHGEGYDPNIGLSRDNAAQNFNQSQLELAFDKL